MLWLKAWLQESALKGPRCINGGLVREMRLSKQECLKTQPNSDPVAPGCEAELLTAPGFGNSQIYPPSMSLKNANSTKNLPPLPQESDYFYDEYIDYPYNETAVKEKEKLALNAINDNTTTKKPYGNTPTIYAASNMNKTKNPVTSSPSSSGFTFFGVPLPSLNSLLGTTTGRKNDGATQPPTAQRKSAIVSRGNNRVSPPTVPEIQTGGFVPIVPGMDSGFKPMIMGNVTQVNVSKIEKIPTQNVLTKTHTIVMNESKPIEGNTKRQYDVNHTQTETVYEIRASDTIETLTRKPNYDVTTKQTEINTDTPKNNTSEMNSTTLEIRNFTEIEKFEDIFKETIDLPYSSTSSYEESILIDETMEENFTSSVNNKEITTEMPKQKDTIRSNHTPTPLTTLLIPDNQQQFKHPPGRSTITKVSSPHAPLSSSLKVTDAGGASPLLQKDEIITEANAVLDKENQDTSWYFTNYNKTNVQSFVGQSNFYKSYGSRCKSSIGVVLTVFMFIIS